MERTFGNGCGCEHSFPRFAVVRHFGTSKTYLLFSVAKLVAAAGSMAGMLSRSKQSRRLGQACIAQRMNNERDDPIDPTYL
jgi:hypothetical protein